MAQFTRVHGDFKPVFRSDAAQGSGSAANSFTPGQTVQIQGPKLDFFTVGFGGVVTTTQLFNAIKTIQQLTTIYIYEVAANSQSAGFAVYHTGGWAVANQYGANAETLRDALREATGIATLTVTAGSTFSQSGGVEVIPAP
jgi:hypothetical protein